MQEFPKKYDHNIEDEIYQYWQEHDLFKIDEKKAKNRFVISMPPPNVTGVLHLGHAIMLAVEDALIRTARMQGKQALWIPGTDHAGIATQVVVEKKIYNEHKITRHDLGREKFLGKVWEWVKFSRSTIVSQVKKMGSSCDWSREQFTLSEKLSRAVRKSFSNLAKTGKIYKGTYIVNWCSRCQTVLSDIEVKYADTKSKLYYIRYFIEGKGDSITVATVRPETIFGDVAVAVNPKDKRYKKIIGKNVLIPIINKPIPVIADENVDVLFGTGALKITPTHDMADFEIGKKHNLPLDHFAIDKDGNLTKLAGEFAGKKVEDVFENIIQYIDEIGNLEKVEDYDNKVPGCERCATRIQPMVSSQWFVDVAEAAAKSIEYINSKQTNVIPERFNKIFFNWLENIRPWCISRQLWWGHRIPVWHCESGHINVLDEDGVILEQENKKSAKTKKISDTSNKILSLIIFNLIADSRLSNPFNIEELINILFDISLTPQNGAIYSVFLNIYKEKFKDDKIMLDEIKNLENILGILQKSSDQIVKKGGELIDILENSKNIIKKGDKYKFEFVCKECGSINMKQDEDVLDTWFSSALWPFAILGWPEKTKDLENFYPNDVLETGYDIIPFWVLKMMMMGQVNTDQTPFANVYLHGLVRDEKGEKMSKSKGNVVDPLVLIKKYGADSLRLSLLIGSTPGNDLKFSENKVDYSRRFLNKLWNATRYISMKFFGEGESIKLDYNSLKEDIESNAKKLNEFDKWMLDKINELIDISNQYMSKFMLGELGQSAIDTAWHDLCDWYIEISKLDHSDYTDKVLLYSVSTILKILHPFVPFVTEKLWMLLNFEDFLISSNYPEKMNLGNKNHKINVLMDIITEFRNLRQQGDYKPHETVDIFIQGNSSFIDFVKKYDKLLKNIIKSEKVDYLEMTDKIDDDYNISVVMDLKIGLKGLKKVDWTQKLKDLEYQLEQEQQFLQNMRNILSNSGFLSQARPNVIEEKKAKMEEVKAKIVSLEHEINRIKMEKK